EITLAKIGLDWFGPYRGIYYEHDRFSEDVDFVYVDGPTRTRGNSVSDFAYPRLNADLVRMIQAGCKIRRAITDHRYAAFPFYKDFLEPEYRVTFHRHWRSIFINQRQRHQQRADF